MQQIFALGMFSVASLLFGLSAISSVAMATVLGVTCLIAIVPSTYWGGQVAGIAGVLLLGVACHIGAHMRRVPAALPWLLVAIVTAALINAAEGLLQWFGLAGQLWPWVVEPERRGVAFGTFRQPNLFATFLCVGITCVIWLVHIGRLSEGMAWFILVILILAIAASASRTGALEVSALAIAGLVWRKQQRREITRLMIGVIFLLGWATLFLPVAAAWHGFGFVSGVARVANVGQDGRLLLWSNALDLIQERPWAGWGWLEMSYGYYVSLFEHRFGELTSHAHNLPLQIAVEFGLPIALIFVGILLWIVVRGQPWRAGERESELGGDGTSSRQFAWMILLMIVGIHSMLEWPLWYAGFLFLAGLSAGYLMPAPAQPTQRRSASAWTTGVAFVSAVILLALSLVAWQQYAKVVLISKAPFNDREAQRAAVVAAADAWLFRGYVDYMTVGLTDVSPENASEVRQLAEKLLHFSPEPRVIQPLLLSLWYLNEKEALQFHMVRFCYAFPTAFRRWSHDQAGSSMLLSAGRLTEQCQPMALQK